MAELTEDEVFQEYPQIEESTGRSTATGDDGEFVDAPAVQGTWSKSPEEVSASADPLRDLSLKMAAGLDVSSQQQGPSGFGPFASGEQYAAGHPMTQEMNQGVGFGTVLRSGAETAFPYTNEIAAKSYAAMYPQLSEDQWYRVLTERENEYHRKSPIMSRVSDIGGAGAVLGGAGAAATKILGMVPAVGALAASAYGIATGPGVPQIRSDEPGYSGESALATTVGAMAPVVGPGIVTGLMAPIKASTKYIGRGTALIMSKIAKDQEAAEIYSKWAFDPSKYLEIKDPKLARTELYTEISDSLSSIREASNNNKLTVSETEKAYKELARDYSTALTEIRKRASELGEPSSGTANVVARHIDNFKNANFAMYDQAFDSAPSTEMWIGDSKKYGVPYSDFRKSAEEAIAKVTGEMKGPEKIRIAAEARELLAYHTGEMVDDTVRSTGASPKTGRILKDILNSNGKILKDNVQFANTLKDSGVSLEELVSLSKYFDNMNPQSIRPYMTSLHKRGTGFSALADIANPNSGMLSSEVGKKIAKEWRGLWLDKVSAMPEMSKFAEQNAKAYAVNVNFLKPLQDKFTLRGVAHENVTSTFKSIASDTEDQIMNSIRAASRYGNNDDQTLIDLASRLKAADQSTKSLAGLRIDDAIQKIAEKETLADEALETLSKLDPTFRSQFKDLEELALKAKLSKGLYNQMAKAAEEHSKKYAGSAGFKYKSVEDAVNQLGTGRVRQINTSNIRSDAETGIRSIMQWNSNGDVSAVNKAIDTLRKLREVGILDRRQVQGSRQTQQAAGAFVLANEGLGYVTGLKVPPFAAAAAGAVGNAFADRFTSGKWSSLTPWIIEKMMNAQVMKYKTNLGRGLVSGAIGREIQDDAFRVNIMPGSQDATDAINILKTDPKLNPKEKMEAIKKINDEGIEL